MVLHMPDFKVVTRAHVLHAIDEYDELGREAFLERHGFGSDRGYVLHHDGKRYESKAVLGVAYRKATGARLSAKDFSGGKAGAAKKLRDLGFVVDGPDRDTA